MEGVLEAIWRSHSCAHFLWKRKFVHGGGWGGIMETSHSEREAQRSGWESLSPTLHYVFMGSLSKALYAFTPPPPFSLSPITSEESSQPTIRSHKPSAYNSHWKSKCQSLDNVTGHRRPLPPLSFTHNSLPISHRRHTPFLSGRF